MGNFWGRLILFKIILFTSACGTYKTNSLDLQSEESMNMLAAAGTLSSVQATTSPRMDGRLDDSHWQNAPIYQFSNSSVSDNTVEIRSVWTKSYLFIGAFVKDNQLEALGQALYQDDGIELFFDTKLNRSVTMDSDDLQILTNINNQSSTTGVLVRTSKQTGFYSMEIRIPMSVLGIVPSVNLAMGFLVGNNDRDSNVSKQFDMMNLIAEGNYSQPQKWGLIQLSAAQPPAPAPTPAPAPAPTPAPAPAPTPAPQPMPLGNLQASALNSALVIDGAMGEASWSSSQILSFANAQLSDNSVTVRALWNHSHLFLLYSVKDRHQEVSGSHLYLDDGLELFVDTLNNKASSMDADDVQVLVNINNQNNLGQVQVATQKVSDQYVMEVAIPWSVLSNFKPTSGARLGLLIGNNDRDNGQSVQFDSVGLISTGSYNQPSAWAELSLTGTPPEPEPTPAPTPTPTPAPAPTPTPTPAPSPGLPPCTTTITSSSNVANSFNSLSAGQTLCLRAGSYSQSLSGIRNPSASSWSQVKTIRPYGDGKVEITGGLRLQEYAAQYIDINGGASRDIVFRGSYGNEIIKLTSTGTSHATAAHHIRIANCELIGTGKSWEMGIQTTDYSEHNEFIGNLIHDGGHSNKDHGFYLATSNNLVENNEVYRWSGYGIHFYNGYEEYGDSGQVSSNNIVRGNIVHNNGTAGDASPNNVAGILIGSGNNNEAYNNTIYNNNGMGIQVLGCFGSQWNSQNKCGWDQRVYNNTIRNVTGEAIQIHPNARNTYVSGNTIE